jgi:hypothetical protein
MKRSSRRRNASGKRSDFARKKSVNRRRSANGSGGRRRSSSVRCAKKWNGFNARRGIGLLLGAVAVCGAYAVRVRLCARVPQREGAREQVRHFLELNYAFSPFLSSGIEICKMLMFFFPRCARLHLGHCWGSYKSTKWNGGSLENCSTVLGGCFLGARYD